MTRIGLVGLLACTACTATQSPRTIAPGKFELSVGLGRGTLMVRNAIDGDWMGHAMARVGLVDGLDVGFHALHAPGGGGPGAVAIDPKVRLVESGQVTLAVGAPAGAAFSESPDPTYDGVFAQPALYVGLAITPTSELIVAARYAVAYDSSDATHTGFGGALATRFADAKRTWAVQPELGFMAIEDDRYFTLGLTIAVGN